MHLYNRRGRPDSAPLTGTETMETDLADLGAVLAHTGARSVFGHSGGGFVALRAGLTLPLERVAVYDPALCVDGRPSGEYIPEFERLVSEGEYARAMTVMARATYPDDFGAKLPFGMAVGVTGLFLRTPIGRRFVDLMPTIPPEVRRIFEHDGPAGDYAGITAELLLTAGAAARGTSWTTAGRSPASPRGGGLCSSRGRRTTRRTSPGRSSSGRSPSSSPGPSRPRERRKRRPPPGNGSGLSSCAPVSVHDHRGRGAGRGVLAGRGLVPLCGAGTRSG